MKSITESLSRIYRPLAVESYRIENDGTVSYTTTGCGCCSYSKNVPAVRTIIELEESMREMAAFVETLKRTQQSTCDCSLKNRFNGRGCAICSKAFIDWASEKEGGENTMKLCPLFESIETPDTIKGRFESEKFWTGIHAANAKLDEVGMAIEEAIDALEYKRLGYVGYPKEQELIEAIEQLKALLPVVEGKAN